MKRSLIGLAVLAAAPACGGIPRSVDTGGNAPLIVDLDATQPLVIGAESGGTVRGPHKGRGERGGVTGTFLGNGGPMCVVIDPEGSFLGANHLDDGDLDLFVGRAADYTGTPGITMGEFSGEYVDPLGVAHTLNQNLCIQYDLFGLPGAHAGAASPEFCTIETDAGVPYLMQGETFSVPPDDEMLTFAAAVFNGACPQVTESTLTGDQS